MYELDRPTSAYIAVSIARDELVRPVPFDVTIDLRALVAGEA
ncbi:hypothetical protein [Actinocrispum sp. NPDC049592]